MPTKMGLWSRRLVGALAMVLTAGSTASASAQQPPLRIVQGSDSSLHVIQGTAVWTLVPDRISDSDLAALNPVGEIDGLLGPQAGPPQVVRASDGSLYLVNGQSTWTLVPDQISDSDLAVLDQSGELDGIIPAEVLGASSSPTTGQQNPPSVTVPTPTPTGTTQSPAPTATRSWFGFAANGTCEIGECPPSQALPNGSNINMPFDFPLTLGNGDAFHVVGTIEQSNEGDCGNALSNINHGVSVQYLGGRSRGPSQADTLTLEGFRDMACSTPTLPWSANAFGIFSPDIAPGSSTQDTFDGTPTMKFGPYTAPKPFNEAKSNSIPASGGAVMLHSTITVVFGAGSRVGSYVAYGPQAPSPIR